MNILSLIGRQKELFVGDIQNHEVLINDIVRSWRFLVITGSIGQVLVKRSLNVAQTVYTQLILVKII